MAETRPTATSAEAQYVKPFVERWDDLIDWEQRKAGEGGFFEKVLHDAGARTVLDAAAGTGFHSVTLAEAGFAVTAADGSARMLERAAENGRRSGQDFPTVLTDWRNLHQNVEGTFDAVLCLGSSFPHLFDAGDRAAVLRAFHRILNPGGVLVLDHRNFDAIRARRFRSRRSVYYCGQDVNVSVAHISTELCRFRYEFSDEEAYHLEVYPLLAAEAGALLAGAGFEDHQQFGDFDEEFDLLDSGFVIHVARKS
ncbi:class I SAM-dependent methyltransferase [Streptomyces sp. TR06-5]|uniref:class I SAM-dependent methyltransferase n=1 Tax=unclassified Streptomyces TaxID=2593676 RepID=UPI0039A1FDA4